MLFQGVIPRASSTGLVSCCGHVQAIQVSHGPCRVPHVQSLLIASHWPLGKGSRGLLKIWQNHETSENSNISLGEDDLFKPETVDLGGHVPPPTLHIWAQTGAYLGGHAPLRVQYLL